MPRQGKRWQQIKAALGAPVYAPDDAFVLLRELPHAKYTEAVDVAVNLGVDPRRSDQVVRGTSLLPHGTGKTIRVAVFAAGELAEQARQAGAEEVGDEDLFERIKAGNIQCDLVIATPDMMPLVGRLGPILGPRGLMPNPKLGTVTQEVAVAVKNAKGGQVRYRTDRAGIIHCRIGSVAFEVAALRENLEVLLKDLLRLKPAAAKGAYIHKVTVSSTMGPGLLLDRSAL